MLMSVLFISKDYVTTVTQLQWSNGYCDLKVLKTFRLSRSLVVKVGKRHSAIRQKEGSLISPFSKYGDSNGNARIVKTLVSTL